jgi:hypothetical protein
MSTGLPAHISHHQRLSILADRLMGHAVQLSAAGHKAAADDAVSAATLLDAMVAIGDGGLQDAHISATAVRCPHKQAEALFLDRGRAEAYAVRASGHYMVPLIDFDVAQAAVGAAILAQRAMYREAA